MTCITQTTQTAYYIRYEGEEVAVATAIRILHSAPGVPTERLLTVLGGTLQRLTPAEDLRLRKRFDGFNAVQSSDTAECDEVHVAEAAV